MKNEFVKAWVQRHSVSGSHCPFAEGVAGQPGALLKTEKKTQEQSEEC